MTRLMDGIQLKYMTGHRSLQTHTHTHFWHILTPIIPHSLLLLLILFLINLLHIHLHSTVLFCIVLMPVQSQIQPWKTCTHTHTHTEHHSPLPHHMPSIIRKESSATHYSPVVAVFSVFVSLPNTDIDHCD